MGTFDAGQMTFIPGPPAGFDALIDWSRRYSMWPMFFGLSCCFIEMATTFTSRYDLARFGAEVLRGSPRQADLLVVSGTVFKKAAPMVLRVYEQMAEPKWVISMGSCANSGGMYDCYSVVQGVNQILPVDIYVPGCPPRPEALMQGLVLLQERIVAGERPTRPVLHLPGGSQGSAGSPLEDGRTKARDTRGPGYQGIPIRGTSVTPPEFWGNRARTMWTPPPHYVEYGESDHVLDRLLVERFGQSVRLAPRSSDMPTWEVDPSAAHDVLDYLKNDAAPAFARLDDLTAVDESARRDANDRRGYTLYYTLLCFDTASRVRLKVPLAGDEPRARSVTDVWPSANWYECEAYDMFGVRFEGHPNLRRILMPHDWPGFPLRKSHPDRATDMEPYTLDSARLHQSEDASEFLRRAGRGAGGGEPMVLNFGPHHSGTHGIVRFVLGLDGETIRDMAVDIGYHHRAVEKIGERQSWHQYIPYTDRVDYLSGVLNNLAYLRAVETLAGIEVPRRAQYIRVLLSELFRLSNHLLWFGTLVQDLGMMSAVFYAFREREMILDLVETVTGARLHPGWFRIGGVAQDLPDGWRGQLDEFVRVFPSRVDEYEALFTDNPIFRARTVGVGRLSLKDAMEWGVTGPNLRACGLAWDLRKAMPYSSYDEFDFSVPTATEGDCFARYAVRMEEMRQSLKIIKQAAENMPDGRYNSPEYRYGVPAKRDTLNDIESLICHFINVTRGPTIPKGEVYVATELPRGEQGYFIASDGLNRAYRMRIRAPGFANMQALPLTALGGSIADLIAIIGSFDYIMSDIDR